MSGWRIFSACGALLLALPSAWGASPDNQERVARKACLLGDVAKGTEILADLYLDTKNPTHIYNQGRCFEQNGQSEQAVLRFREYLRKAENLPPAEVDAVEKKIKDLEERMRGAAPGASPLPATAGSAAAAGPLPSAAVTPSPDPLQISQPPPPPPQEGVPVYKRWWFWSGVGVVVAGGVVATLLLTSRSGAAHSPPCASTGVTCVP